MIEWILSDCVTTLLCVQSGRRLTYRSNLQRHHFGEWLEVSFVEFSYKIRIIFDQIVHCLQQLALRQRLRLVSRRRSSVRHVLVVRKWRLSVGQRRQCFDDFGFQKQIRICGGWSDCEHSGCHKSRFLRCLGIGHSEEMMQWLLSHLNSGDVCWASSGRHLVRRCFRQTGQVSGTDKWGQWWGSQKISCRRCDAHETKPVFNLSGFRWLR